jgi:hypothetical protein
MTIYATFALACNDCATHYPASPDVLGSDTALIRAAVAQGWTRGDGNRRRHTHRCPDCTAIAEDAGTVPARGICSVCGTIRSVNTDGSIRQHKIPPSPSSRRWNNWCDGSRKPPQQPEDQ